MKYFEARGIVYDTDDQEVNSLPDTLTVECDDIEEVADAISDHTGWLVSTIREIVEL